MIEIRIRHEDESRAVHLCYWDPADLDAVVSMLTYHGVRSGSGQVFAMPASFTTEIVLEDGAAFFEVVLQARD